MPPFHADLTSRMVATLSRLVSMARSDVMKSNEYGGSIYALRNSRRIPSIENDIGSGCGLAEVHADRGFRA